VHNIIGTWCIFSNEGEGGGRRALSGGRGGGARSARRKVTVRGAVSRRAEAMAMGHLPLAVLALILFGLSNADSQTKVHTELISFFYHENCSLAFDLRKCNESRAILSIGLDCFLLLLQERTWEASKLMDIRQSFNFSLAHDMIDMMGTDAKAFAGRHPGTVEYLVVRHFKHEFWKLDRELTGLIKTGQLASTQVAKTSRSKRNIFGSLLHGVADVVTEEELTEQKQKVALMEEKLRLSLAHEISLTQIVRDLQHRYNSTYRYEMMIGVVSANSQADAQYYSRRLWRTLEAERFLQEVRAVFLSIHEGTVNLEAMNIMMSEAGAPGTSEALSIKTSFENGLLHVATRVLLGNMVESRITRSNRTAFISTASNLYLVGSDYASGTPITPAFARVVSAVNADCAQLTLLRADRYRVENGGGISCTSEDGIATEATVVTNSNFRIKKGTTCNTSCLEIGLQGYYLESRNLSVSPRSAPGIRFDKAIKEYINPQGAVDSRKDTKWVESQEDKDIAELQDALADLSTVDSTHIADAHILAWIAIALAVGLFVFLVVLCIRVKRRKRLRRWTCRGQGTQLGTLTEERTDEKGICGKLRVFLF